MTTAQAKEEVSAAAKAMIGYDSFHITAQFRDKGNVVTVSALKMEGQQFSLSCHPPMDEEKKSQGLGIESVAVPPNPLT